MPLLSVVLWRGWSEPCKSGAFVACDLNPYPLLLKEKGDDCEADCP